MSNKYAVAIEDLAVEGPELSDEQLLAVRGGLRLRAGYSTCTPCGYDCD
ncbi:hypothetical protein Aph01nite_60570 [Acrocarpospora phusangensis]|uniref:Uncharacterized protein n=1 Tax=Acrocarpospora phusangensis TaxID=1070424 RepID=A0A919QKB0_9ACTN|nr:hypothetical protein [Acrocarpospora phusangensis]GIH27747.1 hypothetical protein Aph01nite_60570 [Acrocarpospora phusangensis]